MSAEIGTARRMVNEDAKPGEEFGQREQRRYHRFREMLWEHVECCHERFKSDMECGNGTGAHAESQVFVHLGDKYFGGVIDA